MPTTHQPDPTTDIRRAKLRTWIDLHCHGIQSEFLTSCARNGYELSQSELSGLLRQKSFGEKKARAIERGAGMPSRHLDTPDGYTSAQPTAQPEVEESTPSSRWMWPFKKIRPEQYDLLDDEQRVDIEKYVLLQVKSREPPPAEKHESPATKLAKVQSA